MEASMHNVKCVTVYTPEDVEAHGAIENPYQRLHIVVETDDGETMTLCAFSRNGKLDIRTGVSWFGKE